MNNLNEMNFKEELQTLSENHNSPKLEHVKSILKKVASNGKKIYEINKNIIKVWHSKNVQSN